MSQNHIAIADMPIDERPRERMMRGGAGTLSDAELIALLIEPGRRGKSAIDIAREIVADGLVGVARREWFPGRPVGSLGPSRVARIGAALELGRRVAALSTTSSEPIRDPTLLATRLIANFAHRPQEVLGGVYVDSRHRLIREREIYIGTVSSASVSPRDVFRHALIDNAAGVIVFHNHPSGDPTPSSEDLAFTRKLVDLGRALDVEVLDHIIVASGGFVSFQQRGLM